MPERILLKRTKGWRKPEGAISVGRPSRYGNPFKVTCENMNWDRWTVTSAKFPDVYVAVRGERGAAKIAVKLFRQALTEGDLPYGPSEVAAELAGHDLGCWCRPSMPCHADVLLEVANA